MTGSISGRVSLIAEDLFASPAKLFIFFRELFAPVAHLYFEINRLRGRKQVFEFVFPKNFSALRAGKILRNRDCVSQARPFIDLCFQFISRLNRADAGRCSG